MFSLFGKKEPQFLQDFPIKMVAIEGNKWIDMYGVIENTSKETIEIKTPLITYYLSNNFVPITPEKEIDVYYLEIQKDQTVKLYNFESKIKEINSVEKLIVISKPSKHKEKVFGKAKEIINNFDFEVELDLEYNAIGVPHTQKGKTYRIFSNGISMFTSIPIPVKTLIEVSTKIPYVEYIDIKKEKFTANVVESKQLEKKKFETILNYEKIEDRLKNLLLEYSLLNQKI
ncbi:MAG: hypothetical protein ACK4GR_03130 [bacterium]